MPVKVYLSTGNRHKLEEFRQILGHLLDIRGLDEAPDFPEPEETGATFGENSAIKALALSRHLPGAWVVADDSGLEVDALQGEPGVRSARFAGPQATDADNRRLLAERLTALGLNSSPARFRCIVTFARDGEVIHQGTGSVEGIITTTESGTGGFGYDAMFRPLGQDASFAEWPAERKNRVSHRSAAIHDLMPAIEALV
jgi:XTP/dITP diphosphohydrolase